MVFLTLPAFPGTFATFGEGFTVHSLKAVSWLANCSIYYWGDLDAHGFQILSLLRETFSHVFSIMMDEKALHTFSNFWVDGTPHPAQPTTERLLEAFNEITLTIVAGPGFVQRHLPPLSALQQQILALCGFSSAVYTRLTDDS